MAIARLPKPKWLKTATTAAAGDGGDGAIRAIAGAVPMVPCPLPWSAMRQRRRRHPRRR
jgi:hypothetical protein